VGSRNNVHVRRLKVFRSILHDDLDMRPTSFPQIV